MALANAIGQLQHIQGLNEFIAIDTTAIVIGVGVCAVALIASAAIVTLIGTIPAMIGSGAEVIISVGGVTINLTAMATAIIGFFGATFLGAAVWEWTALVVLGIAAIATWELAHPASQTGIVGAGSSTTTTTTTHATSITIFGGGASNGGQTVVVNGDGTGADIGGLSIGVQGDQAADAAFDCTEARADYGMKHKKLKGNFNVGIGYAWMVGAAQVVSGPLQLGLPKMTSPKIGVGGPPTHSEPQVVAEWEIEIPTYGTGVGNQLILLLFTINPMCFPCRSNVPMWVQQLAGVAGAGVTIHFYAWQAQDPLLPVDDSNIEPTPLP